MTSAPDTSTTTTTTAPATTTTITYTPGEGDATYRNGKVMVWKGNEWVVADDDVKMDDGGSLQERPGKEE